MSVPNLTHTDERMEMQADYPSNWHLQSFNELLGHSDHIGFIISNIDHDLKHPYLGPDQGTGAWDTRTLPDSAVVIEVSLISHRTYFPCDRATDEFPLDLATFKRYKAQPSYGAPPYLWAAPCVEGVYSFGSYVWLFPDASDEDRKTAEDIVGSIDRLS